MKLLDLANLGLITLIILIIFGDTVYRSDKMSNASMQEFEDGFKSAVFDIGTYLAQLEAQQEREGVRYSKEKQLAVTMDMLSVFYENLALKFGIEGDSVAVENLMLHIPVMVIIRYDGYNIITIDDTAKVGAQSTFVPSIWPLRPFSYVTNTGIRVYFTLDDIITIYDPSTNQYFKGLYQEISTIRDLSPINSYSEFLTTKKRVIAQTLERDLNLAVNRHLQLTKRFGVTVNFSLPKNLDDLEIENIGFFAFIQGYPLPGGELLDSFAFGGGSVIQRKEYIGVIEPNGRHVAYEAACGVPSDVLIIETLYNEQEAAKKGYFTKDCS